MSAVVVVSPEELESMLERAAERGAERALQALGKDDDPALLDARTICKALGIGRDKLNELRARGMPCVRLGAQSPRYDLADCVTWLKANQ